MRKDVALACEQFVVSERRACKLLAIGRSSYRYEPRPDHNAGGVGGTGEEETAVGLPDAGRSSGQARPPGQLDADLSSVSSRRVETPAASQVIRRNQEWAVDFVHDTLATGRGIRVLAVVDTFTRECVSLEVDSSMSGQGVARTLAAVIERRGNPELIRCDNGAPVASLRCRILRLGVSDLSRPLQPHSLCTTVRS